MHWFNDIILSLENVHHFSRAAIEPCKIMCHFNAKNSRI